MPCCTVADCLAAAVPNEEIQEKDGVSQEEFQEAIVKCAQASSTFGSTSTVVGPATQLDNCAAAEIGQAGCATLEQASAPAEAAGDLIHSLYAENLDAEAEAEASRRTGHEVTFLSDEQEAHNQAREDAEEGVIGSSQLQGTHVIPTGNIDLPEKSASLFMKRPCRRPQPSS